MTEWIELDDELKVLRVRKRAEAEPLMITEGVYRCKHCGWHGKDIIEWEEKPRDEFDVKCPKCGYIDEDIEVYRNGKWEPAYVPYEPTPEEIERQKRIYERFFNLMKTNNVYLDAIYNLGGKE